MPGITLVSAFDINATKDFTKNDWKGRNILLFGSEGFGIKNKTLDNADFKFKIQINKIIINKRYPYKRRCYSSFNGLINYPKPKITFTKFFDTI